jgi:hypothetical protein
MFTLHSTINRTSTSATIQLRSLHYVSVFAQYFNTIDITQVLTCPIQIQSLLVYLTLLSDIQQSKEKSSSDKASPCFS